MKAPCKYFRKCSGCTLLQLPYVKQTHDKGLRVRERLAAYAPAESVFAPTEPSPLPLGYRTSTKICLHEDTFGRPSLGLYERGTKKVVAIPGCPVHDPGIEKLLARLFDTRRRLPAPLYQHDRRAFQAARLKFITIRVSPTTGEAGIVLSHTGVERGALAGWVEDARLGPVSVYDSQLRAEDSDRVMGADPVHLTGPKTFRFAVGPRVYALTPMAFFQANHALSERFVEEVVAPIKSGDGSAKTLLDLYGGFGPYGFAAADRCRRILLVDGNPHAIEAARAAALAQGVPGLKGFAASCEDFLSRQLAREQPGEVTHVIVNPPRSGLSPRVMQALTPTVLPGLRGVTYVSCDPATLARDLAVLTRKNGLEVKRVVPFDMFPQTDHIETVVHLGPSSAPSVPGKRRKS